MDGAVGEAAMYSTHSVGDEPEGVVCLHTPSRAHTHV